MRRWLTSLPAFAHFPVTFPGDTGYSRACVSVRHTSMTLPTRRSGSKRRSRTSASVGRSFLSEIRKVAPEPTSADGLMGSPPSCEASFGFEPLGTASPLSSPRSPSSSPPPLRVAVPTTNMLSAAEYEALLTFKRDALRAKLEVLKAERKVLLLKRDRAADMLRMSEVLARLNRDEESVRKR